MLRHSGTHSAAQYGSGGRKGAQMSVLQQAVREQGTSSVGAYRARVYRLAAIYSAIVLVGIAAIGIIVVWGKFFVTLTQRSNVETLTLAFVLVLFAYLVVVCL